MPIDMPQGLHFAVDTWGASSRRRRHRFLTHTHRDHLVGAEAAADGDGTLYATRLTYSLAIRHFPQLENWAFVEMEVGRTVVVGDPAGAFSVTAYDANHCPGAVMFLFEGEFGTILHTGDCRLTLDCVQNLPLKYISKKGKENIHRLDFVFLDCTFSKCFLKLPSKESAIQQVIACIWKHPLAPFVYLACDLLGHEDILVEVSRTFGSKIYVDHKLDCFKALTLTVPEIITDDPSSRFQVIGFHQVNEMATKLEEARASLLPEPLFIRPSTQWYACSARIQTHSLTEAKQDEFGVWHVCFSIHSSRDELEHGLQLLQPKWVISTTPPCFAIDLSYVKKHCFKTRLTADHLLWKIFGDHVGKLVSSPSLVLASETYTDGVHSKSIDDVDDSSSASEHCEHSDLSTLKLASPPPEEPCITLFGRARFASQEIDIMKEEICNQYIAFEEDKDGAPNPNGLIHGSVVAEAYSDIIMKQSSDSQQIHVESGDEPHSCQRGPSPVESEAPKVPSLLATVQHRMLVATDKHDQSDHLEAEDEACFFQRDSSPMLSEVLQVQSLPTVACSILVGADQHEKSAIATESKPLISAENSSISMVRSGERMDCQEEPLCNIVGSSRCLNPSLERLYRSMNIPVPQPLPSLVSLFESSKRIKAQPNWSS